MFILENYLTAVQALHWYLVCLLIILIRRRAMPFSCLEVLY